MPNINVGETDRSNFLDQQFIQIAYNGKTNTQSIPLTYRVTFIANDEKFYIIDVGPNQKISAPVVAPIKEDYTFKHWDLDDEEFDFENTVIMENIILIAKFEENADLTRTATNCSVAVTVDGSTVEDGKNALSIGSTATITATADDGYTLSSLKVNGSDFTSGSTLTVSGDVVIEAVAEESPEPSGTVIIDFVNIPFVDNEGMAMYMSEQGVPFDLNNAYKKCVVTLDGAEYEASSIGVVNDGGSYIQVQSDYIDTDYEQSAIVAMIAENAVMIGTGYTPILEGTHDLTIEVLEDSQFYGFNVGNDDKLKFSSAIVEGNDKLVSEGNATVLITVDGEEIYNETVEVNAYYGEPDDTIGFTAGDGDYAPPGLYQAIQNGKSIGVYVTGTDKSISFENITFVKDAASSYYHHGNLIMR